jgi:hypothetical protein
MHAGREVFPKCLVVLGHPCDRASDRPRDIETRTLPGGARPAVATTEPSCPCQLVSDRRILRAGACGTLWIVKSVGLVDLPPQILQALSVGTLRLLIQQRVPVEAGRQDEPRIGNLSLRCPLDRPSAGECEGPHLLLRMREKLCEVAHPLRIAYSQLPVPESHGPVLALADELRAGDRSTR